MKDWIKRNLHRRTYGAICLLAGMGLPGSAAPADPPGGNPFGSSNPFASRPANPATIGAPNVRPGLPTNLPGACPDTLANLVSTWPRYRDPMLAQLLDNMKSERIPQAIAQARAQGKSARLAISDLERQAAVYDDHARQAARCASQLNASRRAPDALLHDGKHGVFIAQNCQDGPRGACICQMLQTQLGAEYNRALAEAFACYDNQGRWQAVY